MSGHSKWATIHRQKEVKDAKRGAIFTKMAGAITVAVKQGGGIGEVDKNFRLRLAVEKAKQLNMPKENIQRAIDKGMGVGGAEQLAEVIFEGFLPGGAAVLVESVTDNKLRTAQQVRTILDKGGGSLGSSGAVSYLFSSQGMLRVKKKTASEEEQELELIDTGAEDIESGEGEWIIFCHREKTFEIKQNLESRGWTVESAELVMKPAVLSELALESRQKAERIVELLEEIDDVNAVWTNYA